MSEGKAALVYLVWQGGALATAIYLLFLNGCIYTWWNWIIAVPVSLFLAEIWPIYWGILRPLLGH